nr:immunoglobulin heavy chain junction region [Macaca mulatta]
CARHGYGPDYLISTCYFDLW